MRFEQDFVARSDFLASIQLVASDMDGTLTLKGQFCTRLVELLSQLKAENVPLVIVTGRSAGWVSGLAEYLPIAGAIAENGGIFYSQSQSRGEPLVEIGDRLGFRQQLSELFQSLKDQWPHIQPSVDNPFRITDWTFDNHNLSPEDLAQMAQYCLKQGWSFTYSSIQCHLKLPQQSKQAGLLSVLSKWQGSPILPHHVLTFGDSPNDESLFDSDVFPYSVGVANLREYLVGMKHHPTWITEKPEFLGVQTVLEQLIRQRKTDHK